MKKREVNDIVSDLDKLTANIGLMQNYIDCLSLQSKKAKTESDRALVFYGLIYNDGFRLLNDNLENISDKINSLVNELNGLEEVGAV